MKTKEPKVRKNRTKYYEEFETIKDSTDNVVEAVLKRPPKKDWRFMAKKND